MIPVLTTARLTLRPLAARDAEAIFAMMSDAETMRFWDWPAFRHRETMAETVAAQIADMEAGTAFYWAAALWPHGDAIGSCDLSDIDHHHKRAEIGFLFNRAQWGKGYAQEAMQAVIAYGFRNLGLERLWARFHSSNAASQRLLERLEFQREGTLRRHIIRDGVRRDCEIYGRMR